MSFNRTFRKPFFLLLSLGLIGCSSYPPIKSVEKVDIDKFMGDWYVIANIPTFIEEGAHNAIETYKKSDDGTIATTFTFNADSFTGEKKVYNPTGFIVDENSNAIWEMQFIWPFKSDYRIIYLDETYTNTIIGRIKRDYVWIMSRQPKIETEQYMKMLAVLKREKYDIKKVKMVPQQPLSERQSGN